MADVIRMPEVMAGAAEAAIQTWLVAEGTPVEVGTPLAEIETDKAIVELAAEASGTVGRLLVPEGDRVAVGDAIIVLLSDGEGDDTIAPALAAAGVTLDAADSDSVPAALETQSPPSQTADAAPTSVPATSSSERVPAVAGSASSSASGRTFTSPLVRRLAAERGVAISDIAGTGPNGRVVRRDLERHLAELDARPAAAAAPAAPATAPAQQAAASAPAPAAGVNYEDVPLDRMRKTIARRLTESKTTVPHFYLVADCRVDALLELRATVNAAASRRISVNDFVLKAVAAALVDVPAANAIWNGDSIRQFSSVDLAVAVATEGGLTTPVLRDMQRTSLTEVSATVADLAERARTGRLRQHELEGGSFSVSNLGMYGTSQFSAILNPPQSGILAVGAIRKTPVVDDDGELTVGTVMTVTLSADHRVLDGAVAAAWLSAFQRRIENPLTILI